MTGARTASDAADAVPPDQIRIDGWAVPVRHAERHGTKITTGKQIASAVPPAVAHVLNRMTGRPTANSARTVDQLAKMLTIGLKTANVAAPAEQPARMPMTGRRTAIVAVDAVLPVLANTSGADASAVSAVGRGTRNTQTTTGMPIARAVACVARYEPGGISGMAANAAFAGQSEIASMSGRIMYAHAVARP